jgi:hypothetical protein
MSDSSVGDSFCCSFTTTPENSAVRLSGRACPTADVGSVASMSNQPARAIGPSLKTHPGMTWTTAALPGKIGVAPWRTAQRERPLCVLAAHSKVRHQEYFCSTRTHRDRSWKLNDADLPRRHQARESIDFDLP